MIHLQVSRLTEITQYTYSYNEAETQLNRKHIYLITVLFSEKKVLELNNYGRAKSRAKPKKNVGWGLVGLGEILPKKILASH